jgi:hypothetical protein
MYGDGQLKKYFVIPLFGLIRPRWCLSFGQFFVVCQISRMRVEHHFNGSTIIQYKTPKKCQKKGSKCGQFINIIVQ